jgi:hypothetical protein
MTNNKQQTAVEWFANRIKHLIPDGIGSQLFLKSQQSKAKAMHKDEIEQAFANGVDDEYEYHINNEPRKNTEQYYNETFGGKNE